MSVVELVTEQLCGDLALRRLAEMGVQPPMCVPEELEAAAELVCCVLDALAPRMQELRAAAGSLLLDPENPDHKWDIRRALFEPRRSTFTRGSDSDVVRLTYANRELQSVWQEGLREAERLTSADGVIAAVELMSGQDLGPDLRLGVSASGTARVASLAVELLGLHQSLDGYARVEWRAPAVTA